ncbi:MULTISPECIES: carbonate dehydratase [Brachymonas]|uniref:carbonate dehydratase n=1 Tax=Brachymonas TaxID=28219 RepID=UPI001691F9A4|nr:carbonate dehydratase [Brachymonas sp. J145]MEE1652837.1 carbonate dehydratase [Brachymonas sp. J145]NLX17109.1 carbonate dehydratase [Ramlibacter sp.]
MTDTAKKKVDNLENLFESNRRWAEQQVVKNPGFFSRLLAQQNPEYMWIGCSDSRVPANQITGLDPGEVFVHRNVANVVVPTDLNCLSTLQYAVDQLKVKHVLVVGHYGCGGVAAALHEQRVGLADNWIRHVRDVYDRHIRRMERVVPERQLDGLCELNTIEQVIKVAQTTVVTDAWARGQDLTLHGWVYGISDGLIHDMHMTAGDAADMKEAYLAALEHWEQKYCG